MFRTTLGNNAKASPQPGSVGKGQQLTTKAAPLIFSNCSCGEGDASFMQHPSSPANRLLSALPKSELKRLESHASQVALERDQMLLERGHSMQLIYFPTSGLVSLLLDGRQSGNGVGVVGRNGMVGTVLALGTNPTFSRARVEIAGSALAIPAPVLREEFTQGGALHKE